MVRPYGLDDGLAPAARHVDIEQHHIWESLLDELDSRRNLVGLPDDEDGISEAASDSGPEQVVVVDEKDPRFGGLVHDRPG